MNGLISLISTLTLVKSAPLSLANSNFTTYHNSQEHKPILVGYWHNWDNGVGYQGGTTYMVVYIILRFLIKLSN